MVQWCNSEGLCSRLLRSFFDPCQSYTKSTGRHKSPNNRSWHAVGYSKIHRRLSQQSIVCLSAAAILCPLAQRCRTTKLPCPQGMQRKQQLCSDPCVLAGPNGSLQLARTSVTETPEHSLPANRLCSEVPQNISPRFARCVQHSTPIQRNKTSRGKVQEVDVCSELVIFYLWLESYIYIYTYYEIYYVDLLNLMLTVLLLNQGCSLGSFASIPWKRKTNLNYLQMVKKEGWPHLTRPDQMKWGERPNSFVAHVYHVLLGLPAVFV